MVAAGQGDFVWRTAAGAAGRAKGRKQTLDGFVEGSAAARVAEEAEQQQQRRAQKRAHDEPAQEPPAVVGGAHGRTDAQGAQIRLPAEEAAVCRLAGLGHQ